MDTLMMWVKMAGGAICAMLTAIFGGLDTVLSVLLILMLLDYLSGVWSAVLKKTVSSRVGFNGLLKKVMTLAVIAVAHLVGQTVGAPDIRSFVIGFYIANEGISILENAGDIGVPMPSKLIQVLECLKEKGEEKEI